MNEQLSDFGHDQIRDDLGPYAFGTLDDASAVRVANHLPTCQVCSAALRDYQNIVQFLPASVPMSQPPPGARARLLDRARSQEHGSVARVSAPPRISRLARRSSALQLALTAALLLALTGAGVALNAEFGPNRVPYQRTYEMWGEEAAPDAAGLLVYSGGGAMLVVADMPTLGADRIYQLWLVTEDDDQVSAAVFSVDERGMALVPVEIPDEVTGYHGCGVTEEPRGGSDWPTGADVLVGPQWPGSN